MMFTDKFITFPTREFNQEEKDITGKENCHDTIVKIDPFQISNYRDTLDEDGETRCVSATLKNGEGCFLCLTLEEFEKRLNEFNR